MCDEKICPIMSRPNSWFVQKFDGYEYHLKDGVHIVKGLVYCQKEKCEAWVPEQTHEFRCTCDLKDDDKCPISMVVDIPDNVVMFCDGCDFFKSFKIKPIPAHCKLMGPQKIGVLW
jgi:hypothetical protein